MTVKTTHTTKSLDSIWNFRSFTERAVEEGFLHEPPVTAKPVGAEIVQNSRTMINFSSINFLNLHQDPEVLSRFNTASMQYGLVTGGSRMTQGVCQAHIDLEREMCRITGKERCLTFASGLLANIGFLNAMTSNTHFSKTCEIDNRDTVVIFDRDNHWSLWKGASHLQYGKHLFAFKHNDPEDLERILKEMPKTKVVVMFESVYSSDGSIAPMGELLDICEKYDAVSYVDDANGFLIYGTPKRQFYTEFREISRATFIMVSFSKSVGMEGGAIVGPDAAIRAFEWMTGTSMFTAAIQPPTASVICQIIKTLSSEPSIIDNYLERATGFRLSLEAIGCKMNEVPSYINSVFIGNDAIALKVRDEFIANGFCVPVFRYPAVKPNHALLRLILNKDHTEEHLEKFFDMLSGLRVKYSF